MRVACYDWRLAPNVSVGNLTTAIEASKGLVEEAYASDSNTKVYLAAHGNGVLYALSLLNSQVSRTCGTRAWPCNCSMAATGSTATAWLASRAAKSGQRRSCQ